MTQGSAYWAVVPAAGVGRRMGYERPKQYLPLQGRLVIEHTLGRLLDHPAIAGVYVAISDQDGWWPETDFAGHPKVQRVSGGEERCQSVMKALQVLQQDATDDDWVLVHDAARPCIRQGDIDRLIGRLSGHPVGGLLGFPVRDTMKQVHDQDAVLKTVPREVLWHAFTPQMFRLGLLASSLEAALASGQWVTDDASAIELAGHTSVLVEGHADNIKITQPEDLALAEFFLLQQEREYAHRSGL